MPAPPRPLNRLLASLPENAFGRLLPDLKTIPITRNQIFYRQGDPVEKCTSPTVGSQVGTRLHFETALSQ